MLLSHFTYLSTYLFVLTPILCLAQQQAPLSQHHVPNNHTIPPALFAELEELSRIVDIAYCVGDLGLGIKKPFTCPSRCKDFQQFELVETWNTGPLLSDSCGYIALSHSPFPKRVILAFRGTYSITNTIADLSTVPQEYVPYPGSDDPTAPKCANCSVHTGFYTSWQNTRKEIMDDVLSALNSHPDYELVLVGHSLGGAVAAIAGLDFLALGRNPTVTTFGEPRIGNAALSAYFNARFNLTNSTTTNPRYRRITHIDDPVPHLPLQEWGYVPHAGEIFISKKDLPPENEDVQFCHGDADESCSSRRSWWTRLKLWQLFFAHRDYFWRLGLCLPEVIWPDVLEVELRDVGG
jgi:pimeloyl-ACP methyl ester carboxylesterase